MKGSLMLNGSPRVANIKVFLPTLEYFPPQTNNFPCTPMSPRYYYANTKSRKNLMKSDLENILNKNSNKIRLNKEVKLLMHKDPKMASVLNNFKRNSMRIKQTTSKHIQTTPTFKLDRIPSYKIKFFLGMTKPKRT